MINGNLLLLFQKLLDHFPNRNVELSAELYIDPEIDDRYITLYVRQSIYASDITDKIESFCRENNKLIERAGIRLITTDFQESREFLLSQLAKFQ